MHVDISKALVPNQYKVNSHDGDKGVTKIHLIAVMNNVCREPLYFHPTDITMLLGEEVKLSLDTNPEFKNYKPRLIFPDEKIDVGYPVLKVPFLPFYNIRSYLLFRYGLEKDKMFRRAYFEMETNLQRLKDTPHIMGLDIATVDYNFSNLN